MSFNLGDYVRFVNERQEGIVTKIIDSQLVGVTIEKDFEVPVLNSELVLVNRGEKKLTDDLTEPAMLIVEAPKPVISKSRGIYLAFTADKALNYLQEKHILNTTEYHLFIQFYTEKKHVFTGEWAGVIAPGQSVKLASSSLRELEEWPVFYFQVVYLHKGEFEPIPSRLHSIKLKPKQFSLAKKQAPLLSEPAYLFSLDEEFPELDAKALREAFFTSEAKTPVMPRPLDIVDLHFEQLPTYEKNISNQEMLKLQMNHFQKSLDAAISNGMEKIVFIHGVGNGVLRHEIHKKISNNSYIRTFKDAGKDRFGYGATEVYLK